MSHQRYSFSTLILASSLAACVCGPSLAQDAAAITAESAGRLRAAETQPLDVWGIRRGPQAGELTLIMPVYRIEGQRSSGFKDWRVVIASEDGTRQTLVDSAAFLDLGQTPNAVAVSPNGLMIAKGDYERGLSLETRGGRLKRALPMGKKGGITPVFSPDGQILAAGNRNDQTRLFEVATGRRLRNLPWTMTHELAFHPDGKSLAIAYVDGDLGVWDVATGKLVAQRSTGNELQTLDWNPDGSLLATAGAEGKIIVWKAPEYEKVAELDGGQYVRQVRFITGGTKLLTAGATRIDKDNIEYKLTVWIVGE